MVALLAPWLIVRRFGDDAREHPVASYALRMFGVRTVLIAIDLLRADGHERAHAIRVAPIIHASDAVTAALAARSGKVPASSAAAIVAISSLNTVLAVLMQNTKRRRD